MGARIPGSMGGVLFYIGEIKNFAFLKLENFQKMFKKSIKYWYFFENVKGNFAIFWKCFKSLSIFRKILGKKLIWKSGFVGAWGGGEALESCENIF